MCITLKMVNKVGGWSTPRIVVYSIGCVAFMSSTRYRVCVTQCWQADAFDVGMLEVLNVDGGGKDIIEVYHGIFKTIMEGFIQM